MMRSWNRSFIMVWKVAGLAVSPKYIHYQWFKKSAVCPESSFPLVTFLDVDIIVAPLDVQFCEVPRAAKSVNEVVNKWKGVSVLNSDLIQSVVILDELEDAVLFLDKKDWGSDRRFRWAYVSSFECFIKEGVEFRLLIQ